MSIIFAQLLNMSITASFLILAVVILRIILNNAPKWLRCIMWGMVAVKLIIPYSLESKLSLVFNAQKIEEASSSSTDYVEAVIKTTGTTQQIDFLSFLSYVWLAGVVLMLGYMFFSYVHLRRKVSERVHLRENIFICDHIRSPFVLGMVFPKIYLLSSMTELEAEYVIAHEKAHLKRHDNIWKPMAFILLSIYWFNPLCWLAYFLFNKDIELACDEKVIRELDTKGTKAYSIVLLLCSSGHHLVSACPVAFGENNIKQRIKNVLKYKKPTALAIITAITLCVAVSMVFMTSPVTTVKNNPEPKNNTIQAKELATQHETVETEKVTEPATKKPKRNKKSTQPATESTKTIEAETQTVIQPVTKAETQPVTQELTNPVTQVVTKPVIQEVTKAEPVTTEPTTANKPSRNDSLVDIEPFEPNTKYNSPQFRTIIVGGGPVSTSATQASSSRAVVRTLIEVD